MYTANCSPIWSLSLVIHSKLLLQSGVSLVIHSKLLLQSGVCHWLYTAHCFSSLDSVTGYTQQTVSPVWSLSLVIYSKLHLISSEKTTISKWYDALTRQWSCLLRWLRVKTSRKWHSFLSWGDAGKQWPSLLNEVIQGDPDKQSDLLYWVEVTQGDPGKQWRCLLGQCALLVNIQTMTFVLSVEIRWHPSNYLSPVEMMWHLDYNLE